MLGWTQHAQLSDGDITGRETFVMGKGELPKEVVAGQWMLVVWPMARPYRRVSSGRAGRQQRYLHREVGFFKIHKRRVWSVDGPMLGLVEWSVKQHASCLAGSEMSPAGSDLLSLA